MPLHRLSRRLALLGVCVAMATMTVTMAADTGHAHQHQSPEELPKNFNDPKITQDEEHLREHLKDEINMDPKKMTPEQMEFYYFKLHDSNNDTHLDGTEILQAMSHMLPVPELQLHEKLGKSKEQQEAMMQERHQGMMKYYEDMIDQVLEYDDIDKNGYLTYSEFARARRRDEYNQRRMQNEQMRMEQSQYEQFQQFQAAQNSNTQAGKQGQFRPTVPPPTQNGQPPRPPQQQNQQQQQQQFEQFQQFQQQQQQQQQQFQQQPNVKQQL